MEADMYVDGTAWPESRAEYHFNDNIPLRRARV
jgi:hypothetical protein